MRLPGHAVRQHGASVDEVAVDVENARAAIRTVEMDPSAYGALCQFLPLLLTPVFALAAVTLDHCAQALHDTGVDLRTVADQAAKTDSACAQRILAAGRTAGEAISPSRIELPL